MSTAGAIGPTNPPPPAPRPGRRRWIRPALVNSALALGSLFIVTLVLELAVRLVLPQQLILIRPDLWQPADTVGWLHRPGVDLWLNTGERDVRVITDEHGFRVGAAGAARDGTPVLILGDSFMEALQVDHEQSFPGLLETELPAAWGKPVAIRNGGMAGWGPGQYRARAGALLPGGRYGLVITALYLGNDVPAVRRDYVPPRPRAQRHRLRIPRGISWREFTGAVLVPLNDFLEVRSHLYLLFRNRLQTLRMRLGLAPLNFPPQYLVAEAGTSRWDVTLELCEKISQAATENGAKALFVLIPAPFQVDSASLSRFLAGFDLDPSAVSLDQPNSILGAGLAARGLHMVDALPAFRAARDSGVRLFGSVDPHLSPEGHLRLARLVTPTAAALLSEHP